jgi:hypothetical protein
MPGKKIYNKNAREKALLEESYSQVHNEVAPAAGLVARALPAIGKGLRSLGGAAATGAKEGAKGAAKQAGAAAGAAAVNKVAGKFGGQQPPPLPEDEGAVDVELDHWWDFDEEDVVMKVYHGALHALPPAQGTPEYETNSEKIFTWLKGKYPQPDDYNIDEVEFQSRTTDDATEYANRVSRDPESRFYDPKYDEDGEEPDEYHPGYGKVKPKVKPKKMEFTKGGWAKNTKAGKEGEDEEVVSEKIYNKNAKEKALLEEAYANVYKGEVLHEYSVTDGVMAAEKGAEKIAKTLGIGDEDAESREERADVDKYEYEQGKEAGERENHAKGVKMALEALEMFKDELHVDGHPEDVNVNELADAHDQLSRALHFLLDETDVEYIIGGRATQRSEAQSQPEQFGAIGEYPE